jgi:preprotein translocase subunit SecG
MLILYYMLLTLFVIVSILLMLLILIQKGRGGGLSSSFGGGGGGGNTAFGAKTGDVLTWATSIAFGAFFLPLAVFLNLVANRIGTPVRPTQTIHQTVPAAGSAPLTPAPADNVPTTMP